MSDPFSRPVPTRPSIGRLAEIREDISTRLWPVNAGMTSESFNALMDQMSQLQLNFELRRTSGSAPVDTRAGVRDRRGGNAIAPRADGVQPSATEPRTAAPDRDARGT